MARQPRSPARTSFELPVGTTRLPDLGLYRIAYQIYGKERVEMPPGWSGHFTDDVGIAYYDAGVHNGRRAHVLHCPWKAGTGSVSLEQYLLLPKRTPITLRFGIAMRPDITEKSDGVTFSAFIQMGDQRTELMREHYAKGEWKDFEFDLSPYAGKEVVLVFQTEPGPDRDASFDFSMLGEPTITVVRDIDTRAALLRSITESRAYRGTARRELTRLANDPRNGILPSTNDPHRTRVRLHTERVAATRDGHRERRTLRYYSFRYEGDDCGIEYPPLYSHRPGSARSRRPGPHRYHRRSFATRSRRSHRS